MCLHIVACVTLATHVRYKAYVRRRMLHFAVSLIRLARVVIFKNTKMMIDYISDCSDKNEFPDYMFRDGLTEYTVLYHVITDRDNKRRFNKHEFVSWKLGQHQIRLSQEARDKYIIEDTALRAKVSSKAIDYYYNVHDIIIPGHHSCKIDDIFREELHPSVSRIIDPYYDSYYTWQHLKKSVENGTASVEDTGIYNESGSPTELSYHNSKQEFDIILRLVDEFIYNINVTDHDSLYECVKSNVEVIRVMMHLKKMTDSAHDNTKHQIRKFKEAHTNSRKEFCLERSAYMKFLFEPGATNEHSCAIFSSSVADAVNIVEIWSEHTSNITVYCMEPGIKDNVVRRRKFLGYTDDITVKELWDHNGERYDYVVVHIPTAGNMGNKVLSVILEKYLKETGTAKILTDSSLVHTYVVHRRVNDDYDNDSVEDTVIGEKASYPYIDKIHKLLAGHIRTVYLENINHYTKMNTCVSFLGITADMHSNYEMFDFYCHSVFRIEHSLRHCIEFGNPVFFKTIMEKLWDRFGTANIVNNTGDKHRLRYPYFIPAPQKNYIQNGISVHSERITGGLKTWFLCPLYDVLNPDIDCGSDSEMPQFMIADTVGELENYKENCSLKTMKYIGIMMACINARTNVYCNVIPFVADRVYTDEQLYDELELTRAERTEIENVVDAAMNSEEMIHNMEFGTKKI